MNLFEPVKNLMTPNPITLSPSDNIKKAEEIFTENRIHHIPVVDKGELVGIISKSDYLYFKRGFDQYASGSDEIRLINYTIDKIMTKGLAKMDVDDKVNIALEVFKENRFHAIPILENGRLAGILTTYDIINALANAPAQKEPAL